MHARGKIECMCCSRSLIGSKLARREGQGVKPRGPDAHSSHAREVRLFGEGGKILKDDAAAAPLLSVRAQQALPRGRLKDVVHSLTRQRGAFEVFLRLYPPSHVFAFFRREELFGAFAHLFLRYGIIAEVLFQADEDYGHAGAAIEDFGVPGGSQW